MTPNGMVIIIMFLFLLYLDAFSQSKAQLTSDDDNINKDMYAAADVNISFRPSVAVVIGILSVMFSLTFLLLVYAKYCHIATSSVHTHRDHNNEHESQNVFIPITNSRSSGVDKALIESLPMFKFSTLKGSKDGLECAVCLSKFEDVEILRLLPKCKHAFHINCVDKWLESHSSCPLCRHKVDADDLAFLKLSNSSRLSSQNPSSLDLREDSNFELFIKREPSEQGTSSRFSIGSSFRRNDKGKKDDDELLLQEINVNGEEEDYDEDGKHLDKFKHKIMISDIVYKNRWSDVKSSDLMFLNSEMLNNISSKRFSTDNSSNRYNDNICIRDDGLMTIREEMERKRMFEKKISRSNSFSGTRNFLPPHPSTDFVSDSDRVMKKLNSTNSKSKLLVSSSSKRSMSEIKSFSRFGMREISSSSSSTIVKDERRKRLWLPIARRTVQWIAGRERRSQQHEKQDSLV